MAIRLAHFSDVHLTSPSLGWRSRDLLTKKVTGWINVKMLGRGNRFKHASMIADILVQNLKSRSFDAAVFTGDATKLAFESEFAVAAKKLCVGDPDMPRVLAVPGNHDYYIRADADAGKFENHFAPWVQGERVGSEIYPYAVKVGHCWFVAVNAARANFWTFDATGKIGHDQFERLQKLCETLTPGPRILFTHYPLRKANRRLEAATRRLRDHRKAVTIAKECGISLWLHGHIHKGFCLQPEDDIPFPVICVGSATQTNRWSYNEYEIDGLELKLQRRIFDLEAGQYQDAEKQVVTLSG